MTHELHTVATGGTLDSKWEPSKDTAVPNDESIVPRYFENVRLPQHNVTHETVCLKDSRDIDADLQDKIAAVIAESIYKKILAVTGTYLMPDFARGVKEHPASKRFKQMRKRVVLTGSGTPMNGYLRSDGGFNLGMGTAVLQEDTDALISIVMNGMCLDVERGIKKDLTKAILGSSDRKNDVLGYNNFTLIPVGGSIDFEPDGLDGVIPARNSIIPAYLRENVHLQKDFDAINPCVKDSRELKDEDIDLVVDIIKESTSEHTLITLGIYDIRRVQEELQKKLEGAKDRKIILTGSRYPLASTDMTDATFNLGYALGKMPFAQNGVNVALNGMLLEDDDNIIELLFTKEEQEKLKAANVTK
ncbi:MAG: asparaginase domain-containing protein [Candidatus Peregrinibacteria bacterium]